MHSRIETKTAKSSNDVKLPNLIMYQYIDALGRSLHAPSTRRSLLIGVSLFLLFKLMFVAYGVFSAPGPRLGDDAYVYLWLGESSILHLELDQSAGVNSLRAFAEPVDVVALEPRERLGFLRPLMRTLDHSRNFLLHAFFAPVFELDIGYYSLFLIQEAVVACVMAIGFFVLFASAPPLPGIAFLVPLMALAILPGQGLHFLIPSTLALSFGLICWGVVMGARPRPVLLYASGLAAVLAHPIGIAHAGIAGLFVTAVWLTHRRGLKRAIVEASCLLLVLASWIALEGSFLRENTLSAAMIKSGLVQIPPNLLGMGEYLKEMFDNDKFTPIILIAGLIGLLRSLRSYPEWGILAALIAATAVLSAARMLEGYPGEVPIRFLVPLFIILFAFAYAGPPKNTTHSYYTIAGLFYVICAIGLASNSYLYSVKNLEKRWPLIERDKLEFALADFDSFDHILYLEDDFAMQSAFIAGAHRFKATSFKLLTLVPEHGRQWLDKEPPTLLATLVPEQLITPTHRPWNPFQRRRYGLTLHDGDNLSIEGFQSQQLLSIRPTDRNSTFKLFHGNKACHQTENIHSEWILFDLASCKSGSENKLDLTLTGVGTIDALQPGAGNQKLNWPWGTEITIRYIQRSGESGRKIDFSFQSILPELAEPVLSGLEDRQPVAVNDRSGIVFFRLTNPPTSQSN